MVKRTITITTILFILTMVVSLIVVLNKSSFAADDDIASGTSGTCSWVIDSQGVLTISPTDGVSGTLAIKRDYTTGMGYRWYDYRNEIKKVYVAEGTKLATHSYKIFAFLNECTEMDLHNLDTSAAQSFCAMFDNCKKLTDLNISGWDSSKVDTFSGMFNECSSITSLDLTGFNTQKGIYYPNMFFGCTSLTSVNLSTWNTETSLSFHQMFTNCSSLTSLDLSNFKSNNVVNMEGVFSGCTSLEMLDISGFDTSSVTSFNGNPVYRGLFYKCASLKSIKIGPNFKFKGSGNISDSQFPTTTNSSYTGKWIREDGEYGPYTSSELYENYDGSYMSGTWVWEKAKYSVTYEYSETPPEGASELPEERTYEPGEQVTVAQNAIAPGYSFNGWSRTGTFEMPAENVVITGSFTANTDIPYIVEHYLEDLNADTYSLKKTDNLTGATNAEIHAQPKEYEGFTFDSSIEGTKQNGTIKLDGSLVLKLYYKRNSYNVSYSYVNNIPNDASELPPNESFEYGEEISLADEATAEGYTFSGWIKDYITMPAQDIEITGYFIEIPKSYSYKVEYFFDGEIDETLEEILNAEKDEEISLTPQTPLKHGSKNYTLVSNNHKVTISINDEDNVIEVYYESDVLDYEFEYPEGDGIPDKYQIKITYKVENGSWDDGTVESKTQIIILKDKDGNYSEEGTGTLQVPEVGNKPIDGYTQGTWSTKLPSKVSSKNNGNEYIYKYSKVIKADIAKPEGKSSNPKTGDRVQRYFLYGTLGTLVLMVPIKIRRKYSRKARKIQY